MYLEVLEDLDPDEGGIKWMRDQLDWQRACLIGDYFMSAISGVQSSLNAAALAAKRYRERQFSDNQWISSQWAQTGNRPVRRQTTFCAPYSEIRRPPSGKWKCLHLPIIACSIWYRHWIAWRFALR
jgi:hypothetical protein